jgi:hypothetical protein
MSEGEKVFEVLRAIPDVNVMDLIALLIDIKPVVYASLKEGTEQFSSIFPELFIEKCSREIFGAENTIAMISKDHSAAIEAAKNISPPEKLGILLGYPECCVEKHLALHSQGLYEERKGTFSYVGKYGSAPFLLNYFFNFNTRIREKNLYNALSKYHQINHNYLSYSFKKDEQNSENRAYLFNFSFISHIPCGPNCEKSISIGKAVAGWMKKEMPDLFLLFKNTLKRPFVIFDTLNWIAFDGEMNNGFLNYKGIVPPIAPIENKVRENLSLGDRISADKEKIIIYKGDLPVFQYDKKDEMDGYLMNFTDVAL